MDTWAIVPVKALERSKSRLSPLLGASERRRLTLHGLGRTLTLLGSLDELARILVVSADPLVLKRVRQRGLIALPEHPPYGLNSALTQATRFAAEAGAGILLIVPIDLPLLEPADIRRCLVLLERSAARDPQAPGAVLVAPDGRGKGSNLVLLSPPGILAYHFGPDSLRQHRQFCRACGIRFQTVRHPRLALDLDRPEDLDSWRARTSSDLLFPDERCTIRFRS